MVKTREDFMPDVGAFLSDVDGDITKAEFAIATGDYADKVMAGGGDARPPVIIKLTIESPELERPAVQSYSVGSSDLWEIIDDGKAIRNIKNPDKHLFRKGSRAWSLCEAMFLSAGDGDLGKGQDILGVNRKGYMTEAEFYKGLSFHWIGKTLKLIDGTDAKTPTPLPEKFLGEAKSVIKDKPVTKTTEVVEDEALDAIIIANATDMTDRELKSFAVRHPEIKKNDAYMKAIVSGKKLKQLEDKSQLTKNPDTGKYI